MILNCMLLLFVQDLNAGVDDFWAAKDQRTRSRIAKKIIKSDPQFDALLHALKDERIYSDQVPVGRTVEHHVMRAVTYPYALHVPENYQANKAYPLIFFLHGGVARPKLDDDEIWWRNEEAATSDEHISVFPAGWDRAMWWRYNQIENLTGIINVLKSKYHVDSNRVHVVGVSDGGTGVYYQAFKSPTKWASFSSLIGHSAVLVNPSNFAEGQIHPANLIGSQMFILNGAHDRLYPLQNVIPYVSLFQSLGSQIEFHGLPFSGHSLAWWKRSDYGLTDFLKRSVRDPLPDELTWETEEAKRFGRRSWLIIEKLIKSESKPPIYELPVVELDPVIGLDFDFRVEDTLLVYRVIESSCAWQAGIEKGDIITHVQDQPVINESELYDLLMQHAGTQVDLIVKRGEKHLGGVISVPARQPSQTQSPFARRQESGRVDLKKVGNKVYVKCQGVGAFKLLLSPDRFDFKQPIVIDVNGETVHDDVVQADVETLMRWASLDADREMLFAAEISLKVPRD